MHDFLLYDRISKLELELDSMRLLVHTVRQEQSDMLQQIKKLKEKMSDGSGK